MSTQAPVRPPVEARPLEVWRCPACNRVLMHLMLAPGSIVEVRCGSCKAFAIREVRAPAPNVLE